MKQTQKGGTTLSEQLLTTEEAAQALRLTKGSLEQRRYRRQAPQWVRIGRRVFYRESDIDALIDASIQCPDGNSPK